MRDADEARSQGAERVAERDPLRHRRHRDAQAERDPDQGPERERDDDQEPPVPVIAGVHQGRDDCDPERDLAGQDAAAGGRDRRHPLQREREPDDRDEVGELDEVLLTA